MMRSLILLLFAATLSFGQILSGVVISKSAIPASGPVSGFTMHFLTDTINNLFTSVGPPPTGSVTNGSVVQVWQDTNGGDFSWVPGSGGTWNSTGLNGKGTIVTNGTDPLRYVLNNTAQTSGKTWSDIVTSTTFTIWVALQIDADCVADATGLNVNALLTDIDTARFAVPYCKTVAGTTSICARLYNGTNYDVCTPITQAAPHVVMVRRDATHLILSLDNGAEQSIATGTTDNLTGGVTLMINFGPTYWPGRVGEILVYSTAENTTDVSANWTYMLAKW